MKDFSKRCIYSGHAFDRGDIPIVAVDRISQKQKIPYKADGVVCPGCGREVAIRNHPMTSTCKVIPMHNKP